MTRWNAALWSPGVDARGDRYKKLQFERRPVRDGHAHRVDEGLESASPGDQEHTQTERILASVDELRDVVAGQMKLSLDAAAFADYPLLRTAGQTALSERLLRTADRLAH